MKTKTKKIKKKIKIQENATENHESWTNEPRQHKSKLPKDDLGNLAQEPEKLEDN